MKSFLPLLGLAALVALSSCNEEEDTATQLRLNATSTFGDQPLVMFEETYAYPDNQVLQLQLFQAYLSDIRLLYQEDGETMEEPLTDVVLAQFADVFTAEAALSGLELGEFEVPARTYTGLRLGFGLPPELNATVPSDYEVTHPLAQNYWADANSYIFFKIEGNTDVDGDGEMTDKLTFHVGGNNNFNEVELLQPIEVKAGGTAVLNLNIDLQAIMLSDDGEFIDFANTRQAHSATAPAAVFLGSNTSGSISLQ
jgi:hypothetical protein